MKNNRKLVSRVKRILEEKNNNYKRKMYMMSFLSESNIKNSKDLMSEAFCLIRALNNSNGEFPKEDYILEFFKRSLDYSKFPNHVSDARVKYVKKSADLRFSNNINNTSSLINEILDNINMSNPSVNSKLEETLMKSFVKRVNILNESSGKIIDLTKMFDNLDIDPEDLDIDPKVLSATEAIQSGDDSSEDAQEVVGDILDDDDPDTLAEPGQFDFGAFTFDDSPEESEFDDAFGGKDPAKMKPNKIATQFINPRTGKPYTSGKWFKGRKSPIYSAWDKLVQDSMKKILTGSSIEAKRKWWIIGAIKTNIVLQKSALRFLGLTEKQKVSMLTGHEYDAAMDYYSGGLGNDTVSLKAKGKDKEDTDILTLAQQGRIIRNKDKESRVARASQRSRRDVFELSEFEIKEILDDLQKVLLRGDFNLESEEIEEYDLLELLQRATRPTPERFKKFIGSDKVSKDKPFKTIGTLDMMFPLEKPENVYLKDDAAVPEMSPEELAEYEAENLEDIVKTSKEDDELYDGEVDAGYYDDKGKWIAGTGQPLFAREEDIKKIREKIEAEKQLEEENLDEEEILDPETGLPILQTIRISPEEYTLYNEGKQEDIERLKELVLKEEGVPENIFRKFNRDGSSEKDKQAKKGIPLTLDEEKEKEEIIYRLIKFGNVEVIDPKNRKAVYELLMQMGASPEEYEEFAKMYNLNANDPRRWDEIAMASQGAWSRTAGSRQYGIKAWFKGIFFGMHPSEKAKIYAEIAERWFERIIVLDLIGDETEIPESDRAIKMDTNSNALSMEDIGRLAISKGYPAEQIAEIGKSWSMIKQYTNYMKEFIEKGPTRKEEEEDDAFQKRKDEYIGKIVKRVSDYQKRMKLYDELSSYFHSVSGPGIILSEKKIERYLLGELEESSTQAWQRIVQTSRTDEEYDARIIEEFDNNPIVKQEALMHAMMQEASGFRIFANSILKEFYNANIWPDVEKDLAYAIKEYFAENYPGSVVGRSLNRGETSSKVKASEGKSLFDTVIWLAMQRVGMDDSDQRMSTPGQGSQEDHQRSYFHGEGKGGSKGDFALKVRKFNEEFPDNRIIGSGPDGEFNRDDVDDLLDDIFDKEDGILGKVSARLKELSKVTVDEVINWIQSYKPDYLDQMIPNAMVLSMFLRKGGNPMNKKVFEKLGKETTFVVAKYKRDFGDLLTSKTWADTLDNYYDGREPIDTRKTGRNQIATRYFI